MSDTISLFQEHLTCKACGHVWEGFLHGFSRGHTVLQKGERVLFVPDDIVYAFRPDFDFTYPELLLQRGWRDIESCPECHSKRLTGIRYDQTTRMDVPCIYIDAKDLIRRDGKWSLSDSGSKKIA